ncbi:MAG: HlyD family efflux transporter periplasmic adaptor subunit [Pirellulales bacterium]|nr:HlyD family efflux transporter periplasmic adaptor subunit [Pirellulales bacterium]
MAVVPFDDPLTIEVDGHVVPYLEISLSAEVAGRVIQKEAICRSGKFVRKGELLISIDPTDYELEKKRLTEESKQASISLAELESEMNDTRAMLAIADEDLKLQEDELERQTKLLKSGATGESVVNQAKVSVLQARNNRTSIQRQWNLLLAKKPRLQSAMELINVRLEQAEIDLQRTRVTSPIDGMIVVESVEENSYVQKGTPLVTIEDTRAVEVKCQLRMNELSWIWSQTETQTGLAAADMPYRDYQLPETPVTVVYRLAGNEYTWNGTLWRYDGIGLDERTRTVPCRVLVPAPRQANIRSGDTGIQPPSGPPALVRGMFVALEIHAKPKLELLKVPQIAIQPGNKVWRIRSSVLHAVDVHVVEMIEQIAVLQVTADVLSVGDRVVVSPLVDAADGMSVRERHLDDIRPPDTSERSLAVGGMIR